MIHTKFDRGKDHSNVLFDFPFLCPTENLYFKIQDCLDVFRDAVVLDKNFDLYKPLPDDHFPLIKDLELNQYSDGFQLSINIARRSRAESETVEDYRHALEESLMELYDIFRDLIEEESRELNEPLPEFFFRHG